MKHKNFHDYHTIESYCKVEGLNAEYFISSNGLMPYKKSVRRSVKW